MQWFILSRDMHVICAPSTDADDSLPIDDAGDSLGEHIVLTNNCAITTYDFEVDAQHADAAKLAKGGYIAYVNKYGQTKLLTLIDNDGDEYTQTWHAEDFGLDLINEDADKVTYDAPHDFAYYAGELLMDTGWTLGVNEISTLTRTLSFDGTTDSKLTRLGDIANQFDGAEIEFVIEMDGTTITKQEINVWKQIGDGTTQQRFVDAVNLSALKTSGTIASLRTALKATGSTPTSEGDGEAQPITFAGIEYDDGQFFSPKGDKVVYDRVAGQTWARAGAFDPTNRSATKGYLVGNYSYDTSDPQELLKRTITQLKSVNVPQESYEASVVDISADIGDYVQIAHNNYRPAVYLSARVQEVRNHYTAAGTDTAVFGNYSLLETQLDPRITAMISKLAEQQKSHPWTRYADDDQGTGISALPAGKAYMAIVWGSTALPSDDPADYAGKWQKVTGEDGGNGTPGKPGADGKTPYFHKAYANSVDGKTGFSITDAADRSYLGTYADYAQADSTDPTKYIWQLIKGSDGAPGKDGEKGDTGPHGPAGKDITSYSSGPVLPTTVAPANSMFWLLNGSGVVTAFYISNGTKWVQQPIGSSVINAASFNGFTFTGVHFVGSDYKATGTDASGGAYTETLDGNGLVVTYDYTESGAKYRRTTAVKINGEISSVVAPVTGSTVGTVTQSVSLTNAGLRVYNGPTYTTANGGTLDKDGLYDSGWVTLVFANGVKQNNNSPVQVRRIGRVSYMHGQCMVPLNAGISWVKLPQLLCPQRRCTFEVRAQNDKDYKLLFYVDTNGQILTVYNTTDSYNFLLDGCIWHYD